MKIEVTAKHDNLLLARQEIEFVVKEIEKTPSRKELREKIAAIINADEKNMVIDVFGTSYGTPEVKGMCRVYKNEKDMKRTELEYILHRNFGKPAKAKPEEAQAAPAGKK